jgi:class 3 adenylate cyclase
VDEFTGDGLMAVFGAPVALEDHALRACHAAVFIHEEVDRLSGEGRERDGVELRLRVLLNSGQVIVGEIGSGPMTYTAIGEQVGMAQRMESVAAPAGVMLSESTARLVGDAVTLSEPEGVRIKGALVNADASHHPAGLALLNEYRDACIRGRRGGDAVRLSPSSRCRNSRRARYGRGR